MLTFDDLASMLLEVKDLFGARQVSADCTGMKKDMLIKDVDGDGRLYMHEFYYHTGTQSHEFVEHSEFLQYSGSVDSTGKLPQVVIPNYVGSYTNCLGGSNTYSFCCKDVCEPLFTSIEDEIRAPHALPSDILRIVETVSVDNNPLRTVPEELRTRLGSIAGQNGGYVPIHGRLFAQWLHHLYPQHCKYPEYKPIHQISLTTKSYEDKYGKPLFHNVVDLPSVAAEWQQLYNDAEVFLEEESGSNSHTKMPLLTYWDPHERLLYETSGPSLLSWKCIGRVMRLIVFVAGIVSTCHALNSYLFIVGGHSWPCVASKKSHMI